MALGGLDAVNRPGCDGENPGRRDLPHRCRVGARLGASSSTPTGGFLDAGQPSSVGEKGPELFIPKTAGNVIPNDKPMAMAHAGAPGLDERTWRW